jgi:hypothetical protein
VASFDSYLFLLFRENQAKELKEKPKPVKTDGGDVSRVVSGGDVSRVVSAGDVSRVSNAGDVSRVSNAGDVSKVTTAKKV